MSIFAERALKEYNSIIIHQGGVNGNPFWNVNSKQFTFVPCFYFAEPEDVAAAGFLFTATDKNGEKHSFKAENLCEPLTHIWSSIPVGTVKLVVEAVDSEENVICTVGERTFFKCSPFPGRENLPKKARSYKDAACLAFKYAFEQPMIKHWAEFGRPDPEFPHNVYPAKTISSVVDAMLFYAKLYPESADQALNIAKSAADYMLSITYDEKSPICGLPPTYCFNGLNEEKVNAVAPAAKGFEDTVILIYPVSAGMAYLKLFETTNDKKYFDAAMKIAVYYKDNVLPNGSWYLQISAETGLHTSENCCTSFEILEFLNNIKDLTNDAEWGNLAEGYYKYLKKNCLDGYNWEGQFEDIGVCEQYKNLTHVYADEMIEYLMKNKADDPEMLDTAVELMHFVEDQFVVWDEYDPETTKLCAEVRSPAGLEQYYCYWPIDGSTSLIARTFLTVYNVTKDELYLEKAKALGDMLTRMQHTDTGAIPTFWTEKENVEDLRNFWINCHIGSAATLFKLAVQNGEIEGI